eukprot:8953658-Pyramimonas_sp.AAC.1
MTVGEWEHAGSWRKSMLVDGRSAFITATQAIPPNTTHSASLPTSASIPDRTTSSVTKRH